MEVLFQLPATIKGVIIITLIQLLGSPAAAVGKPKIKSHFTILFPVLRAICYKLLPINHPEEKEGAKAFINAIFGLLFDFL